jgi:hypothetical protein
MKVKLTPKELLTLDASSLRERLEEGLLTSVDLVNSCLTQIARHDRQGVQLRAIIATAPREMLLKRADELDEERKLGRIRSPLHGIQILVKVRDAKRRKSSSNHWAGLHSNQPKVRTQNDNRKLCSKDSEPGKTSPIIEKV